MSTHFAPTEKQYEAHVQVEGTTSQDEEIFDEKEAARVRHRVDWRLIPALGAMYGISLLDRKNVSNAAIAGMLDDLHMKSGNSYNLVNMSFFITYVLMQPLMILLCRKMGPRIFLPGIIMGWGFVVIGFGFAKNWPTLVALRLVLGSLEAGAPGCLYLLSCWYTRYEMSRRYSLFYAFGSIGAGLSGVIAYGLEQMEGTHGIRGWRWIFIMEGVITCSVAVFAYCILIKFPDEELTRPSWKFLSEDQLKYHVARLNNDRGDVELERFTWKRFLSPATQWYVYGFSLIMFLAMTVGYAFSFTMPIILQSKLHFNLAMSQTLNAPPYLAASILSYAAAWWSDRQRSRASVLVVLCLVSLTGIALMGFADNPWVQYFGIFVSVSGSYSMIPSIMAYQANNIRGQWMRAFCSSSLTGLGGIGGIAGALIFRVQDGPKYVPGFVATMVCDALLIVTIGVLSLYFRRKNKQADRGECVLLGKPDFRFTI